MESRDYKGTVEARDNGNGTATIVGYGVVFNSDSENLGGFIEQVDPGSVTRTLAVADIRGIANHNSDWTLGRVKAGTMRLTTDERGLRYEIDVNLGDPDGVRAYEKVKRGDWDGSSFCFETIQEQWDWDATPARRRLLEIKLVEMGPVAFPAYPDSTATARGALSKIAKKIGQPVDRMVEALRNGEIRSLVNADTTDAEEREIESAQETSPEDGEKRVGKKLSAASLAALQRAVDELMNLMGEMEPDGEPDGDVDDTEYDPMARTLLDALAEVRDSLDSEPEPELGPGVDRYRAAAALHDREAAALAARLALL